MIRKMRFWQPRDDGSVAIEAAITLSVLLLVILAVIEFALAFWQWNTMLLAVGQVGRSVMISKATTPCDTGCAEAQLQAILTSAVVCSAPAAGQTCVNASLTTTGNGTPSMTLVASYGFSFAAVSGPFTISTGLQVPLN